jgi:hypothetical protein
MKVFFENLTDQGSYPDAQVSGDEVVITDSDEREILMHVNLEHARKNEAMNGIYIRGLNSV